MAITNFECSSFMAILEDLEDLKTYFEDPEVPELDMDDPYESMGPSEMLILSRGAPQNKAELLAMLPDKIVMDRLMNRYFNSNSPSQHIIHIPTFTKQYNEFLKNRSEADIHWIATLFMILALGIFFSSFQSPHELEVDSSMPAKGEMRRRMWNLAVQIDLLVAFHLGLPCMIHGIESDTALPRNLLDSDFSEDSTELPPARPMSDYTPLTYPINKARIARGFGLVARLSHSLTLPTYSEVMRVDARIQDVWSSVPSFMKVKPLSECVTDAPMLVIQRFGLAALYQKSRCVLHRRYLVDPRPLKEHDYSRRTCLEAAMAMLGYQSTMFEATKPGAILAQNGWFSASLAINDFLLADMIVALAVQQQNESEDGINWMATCTPPVTKESLIKMLKHSYVIWTEMAVTVIDCRKAANVVRTMLRRIQTQLGINLEGFDSPDDSTQTGSVGSSREQASSMSDTTMGSFYTSSPSDGYHGYNDAEPPVPNLANLGMTDPNIVSIEGHNDAGSQQQMNMADPWGISQPQSGYDWNQFDALTRGPTDMVPDIIPQLPQMPPLTHQNWIDQNNYNDFGDFLAANSWNSFPGM
ncbi:hypothetical protein O1611_g3553 [Lasiodiplodia mahajangana]|uniref:Uncharacterized protein n=1 Tax=Lasiodiplodia mahajangana TaxID=1108764 RepID=A0ACC2JS24_9PEZI|nr:hypothetical protein O1611_g3553 [Lasiodiplodia mahajangana]